jgi:hypothetical protein
MGAWRHISLSTVLLIHHLRFLNSLVFNNEIDSYKPWTLFLIFVSISVLISGVVLLTHKKPEPRPEKPTTALDSIPARRKGPKVSRTDSQGSASPYTDNDEATALREAEEGDGQVVWDVGEASDDEEEEEASGSKSKNAGRLSTDGRKPLQHHGEEGQGLMRRGDDDPLADGEEPRHRHSHSSDATVVRTESPDAKADDEFGEWQEGEHRNAK